MLTPNDRSKTNETNIILVRKIILKHDIIVYEYIPIVINKMSFYMNTSIHIQNNDFKFQLTLLSPFTKPDVDHYLKISINVILNVY